MEVFEALIPWYNKHKRDLPWRDTHDPYYIWLSEVILQQTRVEQGLPYYFRFIEKYPTVFELASAPDDEVMKLWQGLGYYNRASNMLKTARIIVQEYNGVFPGDYNGLIQLKGIGPYTAAAIASFAYNEAKAVVDGNVYRVLSRVFAINTPINSTQGKKQFEVLANEVLNRKVPALHNQAMMELGATVCKPKQANCAACVLMLFCEAYKQNALYNYPVKESKRKPINRYLHYFIWEHEDEIVIRQRLDEGIWNKLYEFPAVESGEKFIPSQISSLFANEILKGKHAFKIAPCHQAKHQLTHQTIYAVFWRVEAKELFFKEDKKCIKIPMEKLSVYAMPRLLDRFIHTILL